MRHNKGTKKKQPPQKKTPRQHSDIKPGLPGHMSSTLMNELRQIDRKIYKIKKIKH